jgi:hypothetical protein
MRWQKLSLLDFKNKLDLEKELASLLAYTTRVTSVLQIREGIPTAFGTSPHAPKGVLHKVQVSPQIQKRTPTAFGTYPHGYKCPPNPK